MKIKLTIEYQGQAFRGWQAQPGLRTVQGELHSALQTLFRGWEKKLGISDPLPTDITGSGRTDAGVHAKGQVASFSWPEQFPFDEYRLLSALNAMTPREMSVLRAELRPESFDARFSPHVKRYQYRLLPRQVGAGYFLQRALVVPPNIDIGAMIRAAKYFAGKHDFQSFRAQDCSAQTTERTILFSDVSREDNGQVVFTTHGRGFLKQMIRIMIGSLIEVGMGRRQPEWIGDVIQARRRELAGPTAPPDGLCLEWVRYDCDSESCVTRAVLQPSVS